MPDTSSDFGQIQDVGGRGLPHHLTAVIFDLDDTLIDTLDARVSALQGTFTDAGIESPSAKEYFRDLGGRQLLEALSELEEREGKALGLIDRYRSAYWGK